MERIKVNCSDDFDNIVVMILIMMYAEEIIGYIKDAADEKGKAL